LPKGGSGETLEPMASAVKALIFAISGFLGIGGRVALAQAPEVPIETQHALLQDEAILTKAAKLKEAGQLIDTKQVAEQVKKPKPAAIMLPEPATKPLRGREISAMARKAYLRLGWYYLCPRCEKWHLQFAGAYAIAEDVIVTCHHCVMPKTEMREGYLIAVDHEGTVHPVTAVLARSQTLDAAILRVGGAKFAPLALQDNVAPGDAAYCFSEPLGQLGYFTTGIVNRFFWQRANRGAAGTLDELKSLRMNVSTDWAPGSSGAAVLDECGNAIGHVATISPLSERGRSGGNASVTSAKRAENAVLITLHEAIPARSIRALALSAANPKPAVEWRRWKETRPGDGRQFSKILQTFPRHQTQDSRDFGVVPAAKDAIDLFQCDSVVRCRCGGASGCARFQEGHPAVAG
jgi:hypothetical protein